MLRVVWGSLVPVRWWLLVVCCGVYCVLRVVDCCLLFVGCWSLVVGRCLLRVDVCCLM